MDLKRIELMSTLIEHRCSEGCRFPEWRYQDGHALNILHRTKTLAGMDTGRRTRETKTVGDISNSTEGERVDAKAL
jgi:hypothetical protein